MAAWMPGMPFVPQAMQQEPQSQTWADESQNQPQMAAAMQQQQQYQVMWMMVGPDGKPCAGVPAQMSTDNSAWGCPPGTMMSGPPGTMMAGPPGTMMGGPGAMMGPPGAMSSPPGALSTPSSPSKPSPPGAWQAPTVAALSAAAANPDNKKETDPTPTSPLALPAAAPQVAKTKAELERQMMIASVREHLKRSTVRKGLPQKAAAPLRHSTFSALNLEVGGRPRGSTVNRRQSLAELKESVNAMRRAQAEKQAQAVAAAAEACPKIDESKPVADGCSPSERTRTPSAAGSDGEDTQASEGEENRAAVVAAPASPEKIKEASFDFSGPQFSRYTLLQFRDFAKEVPCELQTMKIGEETKDEPADRALFGTYPLTSPKLSPKKQQSQDFFPWSPKLGAIAPSETGWKPAAKSAPLSRSDRLRRDLKSLLNKVCPENVLIIVERIANAEIGTVEELELLISLIFEKALAEPHYSETYADMIFTLKDWMPEFPSATTGKPVTFRTALINTCQHEFESLSSTLALDAEELTRLDPEEIDFQKKKKKGRVLANMKFIGQLFLREMLNAKIIGSVIQDLAKCNQADVIPEEPMVECICELLTNIGYTLESSPIGKSALTSVCSRLQELKSKQDGSKYLYSKRIQFAIQDLLEIRAAAWTKKSFKTSAKTKEEIRLQQEKDIAAQARGRQGQEVEVQIAGAKPLWLNHGC